jgi:hypothetical protein
MSTGKQLTITATVVYTLLHVVYFVITIVGKAAEILVVLDTKNPSSAGEAGIPHKTTYPKAKYTIHTIHALTLPLPSDMTPAPTRPIPTFSFHAKAIMQPH